MYFVQKLELFKFEIAWVRLAGSEPKLDNRILFNAPFYTCFILDVYTNV